MSINNQSLHTLVNFRASIPLLESFDRVCQLSGKTRTQVLSEMMRQRVASTGSKLVLKAAAERSLNEELKNAVERQSESQATERHREWSTAVRNRFKPFSSPDFDQVQ